MLAGGGADELQGRHVCAREQQHREHRPDEREERAAIGADHLLGQCQHAGLRLLGVVDRVALPQLARHAAPLRLHLRARRAGREAAVHGQEVGAALAAAGIALRGERQDHVGGRSGEEEVGAEHAHDPPGLVVEANRRADDRTVAAEARPPQRVAEHGDRLGAGILVPRDEGAAERGPHAQQREAVPRDEHAAQALRRSRAGEVHAPGAQGRDFDERPAGRAVVEEVVDREERLVAVGAGGPDPDQAVRLLERERPQHHRVREGVDQRGGGGGEGHRERDSRRVSGGAGDPPQGLAQVGGQSTHVHLSGID